MGVRAPGDSLKSDLVTRRAVGQREARNPDLRARRSGYRAPHDKGLGRRREIGGEILGRTRAGRYDYVLHTGLHNPENSPTHTGDCGVQLTLSRSRLSSEYSPMVRGNNPRNRSAFASWRASGPDTVAPPDAAARDARPLELERALGYHATRIPQRGVRIGGSRTNSRLHAGHRSTNDLRKDPPSSGCSNTSGCRAASPILRTGTRGGAPTAGGSRRSPFQQPGQASSEPREARKEQTWVWLGRRPS
jgi:hypothetical protein